MFTLKVFGAGKATSLVASGVSVGAVLAAGECRSKAVFNYVDEDVSDSGEFVSRDIENSDNE